MKRRDFLKRAGICGASLTFPYMMSSCSDKKQTRTNILFALADDWSWPNASIAYELSFRGSDSVIKTPTFDRIAKEGLLFTNAFCNAPTCSPSRSSILTGRNIWQLETAANLRGILPVKFKTYTDILEEADYHVGYMKKGWEPGPLGEQKRNPAGYHFDNFIEFMEKRPQGKPFCFWFGARDAHRPYVRDAGIESGMDLDRVTVPACLPDHPIVRKDICDYYYEIQRFDSDLGEMVDWLEKHDELENTLVVVAGDNGMPFPRCKVELYDRGTHVPLAIRWGKKIKGKRIIDDYVNLAELGPTFIKAAGLYQAGTMTMPDILNILISSKSGIINSSRDRVFTGREYHDFECREGDVGYPMRGIRTSEFLYIKNFEPDRYPAGDPFKYREERGEYGEVDPSPTKSYMLEHKDDPAVRRLFELSFAKRPADELYDLRYDLDQLQNVSQNSEYREQKRILEDLLIKEMVRTFDPRVTGQKHFFK